MDQRDEAQPHGSSFAVAHLTTVDMSLRFLVWPQLLSVVSSGGEAIGISSPGRWVDEIESAGVRHVPLHSSTRGMSLVSDARAIIELWRVLRQENLTVLHTHNPKPGIYGRILGRLAGVPIVVNTLHGFYATETDPRIKRAVVYGLEAVASRFSDAELHQNPEDLALAARLRIVSRDKAKLLGNGVDLNRFDPTKYSSERRSQIREDLGVDGDQIVVGAVGRLVAEKGYLELFEAVEELGDGYELVVVGPTDPAKADAIPDSVLEQATSQGVRFLGMRTDMEDLYAAMDLFVLPSHREGFPRAAMEAAAMGVPVVATDIRGCRQVVDHEVNGYLVPVNDPAGLAEAIRSIAQSGTMRQAMSEASRSIAEERFDERRVVQIVNDTYREALASKGLSHLMPAGMLGVIDSTAPRPARADEAKTLGNLHCDLISGGFLPRLGRRFMGVLYRGLLAWPGTVAYVVDDSNGVVGFVVGVDDIGAFYRWFLKRHFLAAGFAALPALLRPANLRKTFESARYGGDALEEEIRSEVLSLGVAPRARGLGLSSVLLHEVQDALQQGGAEAVRVVVGASNSAAISAYQRAGFEDRRDIEVHRGETSKELVWRPPS